jgi:uncharacterized membrane protein
LGNGEKGPGGKLPQKPPQGSVPQQPVLQAQFQESSVEITLPTIPPQLFREYENASAGLGKHVISLIEEEGKHRRSLQLEDMRAQIRVAEHPHNLKKRGQIFALVAVLAVLAFAFCLLRFCPDVPGVAWVAGGVTGGTLVSIVGAFIYGQRAGRDSQPPPG